MEKKQFVAFALSLEELFALLKYMKVDQMLGVPTQGLDEMDDGTKSVVFAMAQRSLIAHSILQPDPNIQGFKIADLVHGVLRACTGPEITLAIEKNVPGKAEQKYFLHYAQQVYVLHTETIPFIHQFYAYRTLSELLQAVLSSLEISDTPSIQCKGGMIPRSVITQAFKAAADGNHKRIPGILNKYLDKETISHLAPAIIKPVTHLSLTSIKTTTGHPVEFEDLSFLVGENSLWLMNPGTRQTKDNEEINIQSISTTELNHRIKQLLV